MAGLNTIPGIDLAQLAGTLVHKGIPQLLAEGYRNTAVDDSSFRDRLWALARDLVSESGIPGSHRRRVHSEVGTAIASYWMRWLPGSRCEFVGSEVVFELGSRIDLVWRHEEIGVFFDEIKLSRAPISLISLSAIEQSRRYSRIGQQMFGDAFLGVRLISIPSPSSALLINSRFEVSPLAQSPLWMVR